MCLPATDTAESEHKRILPFDHDEISFPSVSPSWHSNPTFNESQSWGWSITWSIAHWEKVWEIFKESNYSLFKAVLLALYSEKCLKIVSSSPFWGLTSITSVCLLLQIKLLLSFLAGLVHKTPTILRTHSWHLAFACLCTPCPSHMYLIQYLPNPVHSSRSNLHPPATTLLS